MFKQQTGCWLRLRTAIVRLAVVSTLMFGANASLHATTVRPLNLEQLTQRAERIVVGRCVLVETAPSSQFGLPVQIVTVEVDQTLKGSAGLTLTFKTLGGVPGLPRMRPSEEVVLFLYGESASGLTSPVGFGQGKFLTVHDKLGRRVSINSFGNRGLFERLPEETSRRLAAPDARLAGGEAIAADRLIEMIRTLAPRTGGR